MSNSKLQFRSRTELRDFFLPLVEQEYAAEVKVMKMPIASHIDGHFATTDDFWTVSFVLPHKFRLTVRTDVVLTTEDESGIPMFSRKFLGTLLEVTPYHYGYYFVAKVVVTKESGLPPPRAKYTVHKPLNDRTYVCTVEALHRLCFRGGLTEPIKPHLLQQLLDGYTLHGRDPMEIFHPSELTGFGDYAKLNSAQQRAVRHSLREHIVLIHGPPGTGKTHVSAAIVKAWKRTAVYHEGVGRILVSAASNAAVGNLADGIMRVLPEEEHKDLIVVEALGRQGTGPDVLKPLTLYARTNAIVVRYPDLLDLHTPWLKGKLSKNAQRFYLNERRKIEMAILARAKVVCCTTAMAGRDYIVNQAEKFDAVLIDEACQCTEASSWMPLTNGAERVVLVGDPRQLEPFTQSTLAREKGLGLTLFERLSALGVEPLLLDTQYRMHPQLSAFPRQNFYGGRVGDGVNADVRTPERREYDWPTQYPLIFYDVHGSHEKRTGSTRSYLNKDEASVVVHAIGRLCGTYHVSPSDIGVITPYMMQCEWIEHALRDTFAESRFDAGQIEVATVDKFQGREKRYIIFSCVRSNSNGSVGFMKDERRLNVSLTRAKFGLIVIGSADTLRQSGSFALQQLVEHFEDRGALLSVRVQKPHESR